MASLTPAASEERKISPETAVTTIMDRAAVDLPDRIRNTRAMRAQNPIASDFIVLTPAQVGDANPFFQEADRRLHKKMVALGKKKPQAALQKTV